MKRTGTLLFGLLLILSIVLSCSDDDTGTTEPIVDTKPVIAITSPTNDSYVADLVEIMAETSDDKGIYKVDFYIDGGKAAFDPAPPYEYLWNASIYKHGSGHSIYAVAFSTDGDSAASSPVICTIDTNLAPPSPVALYLGEDVTTSSIPLAWETSNEIDFAKYILRFDQKLTGTFEGPSVEIYSSFDTTYEVTGLIDTARYRFEVLVVDVLGNSTPSNTIFAETLNGPPPQSEITSALRLADAVRITWREVNILDFMSYELIMSTDSVFDQSDEVIATISHIDSSTYYYTNLDSESYFLYIRVNDKFGLMSLSDPYSANVSVANYALSYNGTTYCTIPFVDELNLGDTYTLEAWIKQETKSNYMRVIDKSPVGSPYFQYSLISDEYLGADVCGDGSPQRFHADEGVSLNEWHHIALTYDRGDIVYYIDGEAVAISQTGIGATCSYSTTLNIGRRKQFDEFYFRGDIDEVRVWNIVRTPTEISNFYNVHLPGGETGLVCNFGFDEGQGQSVVSTTGISGYLGENAGPDSKDPFWVNSTSPVQY